MHIMSVKLKVIKYKDIIIIGKQVFLLNISFLLFAVCSSSTEWTAVLDMSLDRYCTLSQVAESADIPYLSMIGHACMLHGKHVPLSISPSDDLYLTALTFTAIRHLNLTSYHIAIFYDDSFGKLTSCFLVNLLM